MFKLTSKLIYSHALFQFAEVPLLPRHAYPVGYLWLGDEFDRRDTSWSLAAEHGYNILQKLSLKLSLHVLSHGSSKCLVITSGKFVCLTIDTTLSVEPA